MKRTVTKIISVFLAVLMLVCAAPLDGFVEFELFMTEVQAASTKKAISSMKVGDIIEFGSYPQSEVKDSALISKLNAAGGTWVSYRYMSGAGTDWADGSAQPSDYMRYKDVTLNGTKYRAVTFDTYRKSFTNYKSDTSTDGTYQDDNGYYINTVYWFKYEPIAWRVLDPTSGLVLCESIIDSQAYSDTVYYKTVGFYKDSTGKIYPNNYVESTIRAWLNGSFYDTAFSSADKGKITTATLENKGSETTYDKVFMLTYADMFNTEYGFCANNAYDDIRRRAAGTDYARAQGLHVYPDYTTSVGGCSSDWRLRSAGSYSYYACGVNSFGTNHKMSDVYITDHGIRPAIMLNPSTIINAYIGEKKFTLGVDNANFSHSVNPDCYRAGFLKIKDYSSFSGEYKDTIISILKNNAPSEVAEFNKKLSSKFTGCCFGFASTVALKYNGDIDISELTNDNSAKEFYDLTLPSKDNKLRNSMFYYLFIKNYINTKDYVVDSYSSKKINFLGFTFDLDKSGDKHKKNFLKNVVSYAMDTSKLDILAYVYPDDSDVIIGHAVVIVDCKYDESKKIYKVKLYNENYSPTKDEGYKNIKYQYLYIKDDFSDFEWRDFDGTRMKLSDKYKNVNLVDVDMLYNAADNLVAGLPQRKAVKANSAQKNNTAKISFNAESNFRLNVEGDKYLSFDGSTFSTNMNVLDGNVSIDESGEKYEFIIEDYDKYIFSDLSDNIDISVSNASDYFSVTGENISSVTITDGEDININGDDYSFEVYKSTRSNITDDDMGLVSVSGKATADVSMNLSDNILNVESEEIITDVEAASYLNGLKCPQTYDSTEELSIDANDVVDYEPVYDISDAVIQLDYDDFHYTGEKIEPDVYVSYNGILLEENDCLIEYSDNIEIGKGQIKVTGIGNFAGELSGSFNIVEKAHVYYNETIIEKPECEKGGTAERTCAVCEYFETIDIPALGHTFGEWVTLETATCTEDGKSEMYCTRCNALIAGKDDNALGHSYSTSWTVDKKATMTENGSKSHHCTRCTAKKDATTVYAASKITLSKSSFTYTGKVQKPTVTVKDSKGNTVNAKNYTVTCGENKNVGSYTVKVSLNGDYSGTKSFTYTIVPKAPTGLSATQKATSVTLTWDKVTGASKYEVYVYNESSKKYEKISTVTDAKATIKSLKAGTTYKFKVLAVDKSGKLKSAYSSVLTTSTKCKAPTVTVTSSAKKTVKVSWKSVSGATGYTVYYATSKNGKYKKLGATTKKSYTYKKLTSGKTYYFKVAATKKVDGKTIRSAYSTVKSVKVK